MFVYAISNPAVMWSSLMAPMMGFLHRSICAIGSLSSCFTVPLKTVAVRFYHHQPYSGQNSPSPVKVLANSSHGAISTPTKPWQIHALLSISKSKYMSFLQPNWFQEWKACLFHVQMQALVEKFSQSKQCPEVMNQSHILQPHYATLMWKFGWERRCADKLGSYFKR
jgi:hypothetical protein